MLYKVPVAEIYSTIFNPCCTPYVDEFENSNVETTPAVSGLKIDEADTLPGPHDSDSWPGCGKTHIIGAYVTE